MNLLKRSFLFAAVKTAAFFLKLLPLGVSLWIGRSLGWMGHYFLPRKRKVVYANLKTVFASTRSPSEISVLTRDVFINFIQSAVELLCLPKLTRIGLDRFVDIEGREHIDKALAYGKGVIFLAIHSGSWELASVIGSITKGHYHIVVNDQAKIPQLNKMLNEYRTIAGAHVIMAGTATKEIVKAMRDNEIVSLVLDQGGRTGMVVPFLGKTVSLSTGALRLALKHGSAVCPVWIRRRSNGRHLLTIFPDMPLTVTGDPEEDIKINIQKAALHFEGLLREYPKEYLWFYKVFKYSSQRTIVIVDDGRTGHLRQSQAVAGHLAELLRKRGKTVVENTVSLQWRGPWATALFSIHVFLSQHLTFFRKEQWLKYFLTEDSFRDVMKYKADYVVSCGSQGAGVNYILSQNHMAKSISILTPGLVPKKRFNAVVVPQHDEPKNVWRAHLITPRVSPNLINESYLKEQSAVLARLYPHLKENGRLRFGVLIGGDTQGVKFEKDRICELINQIKEAARHYNADILLTTSRRTPADIEQVIAGGLADFEHCPLCIIANQRNVPEAVGGILGLSELVIVSGESISMVSEALSSGKRTIVFSPYGYYGTSPRDKYEDFVLKLNNQGYLMVSSIKDLKTNIVQLLSRQIALKALDDQSIIRDGLETIL